ncbi:DUF1592 domain-containing protein [Prosthecobacter sp. SYSU 5D2]|uniref:DUF1592 domain-containing protein n=1 Tax=Prosthecobacter sp. SYSU 5D2 TaxID=3134134 RepID=UPI0031FE8662
MLACWKHRHHQIPREQLAKDMGLSVHFLFNWWRHLNNTEPKSRFLDLTRVAWRELPADEKTAIERIKVIEAGLLSWNDPKRPGEGVQRWQQDSDGVIPYPMRADVHGKSHVHLCFGDVADGNKGDIALINHIEVTVGGQKHSYFDWTNQKLGELKAQAATTPPPPDLSTLHARIQELESVRAGYGQHPQPGREIEPHVLAFAAPTVCTLPLPEGAESIVVDTRLDMENPEVEEATIQWTLTTDVPRDVTRVMPGVLTIWKRGSQAAQRTMGEFNSLGQAFADVSERRLQIVAENMHRQTPGIGVYYFDDDQLGQLLGEQDRQHLAALRTDWHLVATTDLNPGQQAQYDAALLQHVQDFAARAWRRPLEDSEKEKLAQLYSGCRAQEMDRESAAREILVRVLVSPYFLFKAETLPAQTDSQAAEIALSAHEVASRLSYFLWSSIPDAELLATAADGSLLQPEVLEAQATRLLKSPKSAALAREFAGQWLKFSGFEKHDAVDAEKFPQFTPELRADMQAEVVEFFTRIVREDRPVTDIIAADYSFLNERLAGHYGIPDIRGNELREVKVASHHRGGLLGMGAILTRTSRSHRTSPVLRGDYLYQIVLGFSSPPPPPDIPELKETTHPASLREALMQHRADAACAVCHDRIDPLGFALETFDPIGRHRSSDDTGARIDDSGELKDGTRIQGLAGLRDYLRQNQAQLDHQFSRKLLGYALGRQVLPSDKRLLADIQSALQQKGSRFSAAVLKIISSRQFLHRRNEPVVADR